MQVEVEVEMYVIRVVYVNRPRFVHSDVHFITGMYIVQNVSEPPIRLRLFYA